MEKAHLAFPKVTPCLSESHTLPFLKSVYNIIPLRVHGALADVQSLQDHNISVQVSWISFSQWSFPLKVACSFLLGNWFPPQYFNFVTCLLQVRGRFFTFSLILWYCYLYVQILCLDVLICDLMFSLFVCSDLWSYVCTLVSSYPPKAGWSQPPDYLPVSII